MSFLFSKNSFKAKPNWWKTESKSVNRILYSKSSFDYFFEKCDYIRLNLCQSLDPSHLIKYFLNFTSFFVNPDNESRTVYLRKKPFRLKIKYIRISLSSFTHFSRCSRFLSRHERLPKNENLAMKTRPLLFAQVANALFREHVLRWVLTTIKDCIYFLWKIWLRRNLIWKVYEIIKRDFLRIPGNKFRRFYVIFVERPINRVFDEYIAYKNGYMCILCYPPLQKKNEYCSVTSKENLITFSIESRGRKFCSYYLWR